MLAPIRFEHCERVIGDPQNLAQRLQDLDVAKWRIGFVREWPNSPNVFSLNLEHSGDRDFSYSLLTVVDMNERHFRDDPELLISEKGFGESNKFARMSGTICTSYFDQTAETLWIDINLLLQAQIKNKDG